MQAAVEARIYALIDPETKLCRYIGKTKGSCAHRLKGHLNDAKRHPQIPRFKWINGLKVKGLVPEVMELEAVSDGWQEAEQFWIAYMVAIGSPLLNRTAGGDGIHNFRHSEETKKRMSEAGYRVAADPVVAAKRRESLVRAYASEEARAALSERLKISHNRPEVRARLRITAKANASTPEARERSARAHRGKVVSEETRQKLSDLGKGRKWSPETRAKMAASRTGVRHSEATRQKMRDTWARKHNGV